MSVTEKTSQVPGAGSVVLDIGEDIGPAIVTAPPSLEGHELEIRALNRDWCGDHSVFRMRKSDQGSINAAVFPQLVQGDWEIRLRSSEKGPVVSVRVVGGRVSTIAFSE